MPSYDYSCYVCGFHWEDVKQSIHDKPKKQCPKCNKMGLNRMISVGLPPFVRGDVNTIGQMADANAKKMGKYGVSEADAKKREEVDQVLKERKEENAKVGRMSKIEQQRFIENG